MKKSYLRAALCLCLAALLFLPARAVSWERVGEYHEGLALATNGSRWGYVNETGSLAIPLRFSQAEDFFLGVATVTEGGKQGVIRTDGTYLLPAEYDSLERVDYGVYIARQGQAWRLISLNEVPSGHRPQGAEDAHQLLPDALSITQEGDTLVLRFTLPDSTDGTERMSVPAEEKSAGEDAGAEGQTGTAEAEQPVSTQPVGGEDRSAGDVPDGTAIDAEENDVPEEEEGVERIPVSQLPELLAELEVPGWAFPLDESRQAAFPDVSQRNWFAVWVDIAYSAGLIEGRTDGKFCPSDNLKICEAFKLVAIMDSGVTGESIPTPRKGESWYGGYLRYCQQQGIVLSGEFEDGYGRAITRAELALLFSRTELYARSADINDRSWIESAIPDVGTGDYAASAIFGLYAKGVLTGSDSRLTFRPDAIITRGEVAALIGRMIRPEQRVVLTKP